jgi:AcrR family transcriptional regulator
MDDQNISSKSQQMQERIIDGASDILVEKGLGGLTFRETGVRVGLKTTSITHYFKRRDELAAACFDRALDRLNELVDVAEQADDPETRIKLYIDCNIAIMRAARLGEDRLIPMLSGIMTLDRPLRDRLTRRYREFFKRVRSLFGEASSQAEKDVLTARAHVLLEIMFWLLNALRYYQVDQYQRFSDRLFMILRDGLAVPQTKWKPERLEVSMPVEPRGLRAIIKAATTLINEERYKGASINKVVGLLGLTKGSFYHHLNSRDALTLECFGASYATILQAQKAGAELKVNSWQRLISVVSSLVEYQFSKEGPLLRTTALQGLSFEQRQDVITQAQDVARGFADLVTDAFIDSKARSVDAMIAGHILLSMINAAYVLVNWSRRRDLDASIRIYAGTVLFGLFSERFEARSPTACASLGACPSH